MTRTVHTPDAQDSKRTTDSYPAINTLKQAMKNSVSRAAERQAKVILAAIKQ